MSYSSNAFEAIDGFVDKFKFTEQDVTEEVVDYRMDLVTEEYQETIGAHMTGDAEGVVDGHVDMIVILMGNLAIMGIDGRQAFDRVMEANMAKQLGKRKETDPEGSSILKPDGWVGPNHSDNHGVLDEIYAKKPEA